MSFLGGDAVVGEVDGDLVACLPASGGGAGAGGGDGLSRFDVFSCVSGLLAEGDEECGGIGGAPLEGAGASGWTGVMSSSRVQAVGSMRVRLRVASARVNVVGMNFFFIAMLFIGL